MTIRQRRLVKGVADGKTIRQAALDAGYGHGTNANSAGVEGTRALQKPDVRAALEKALDAAGATIEKSAKVIADAHEAVDPRFSSAGLTVPDHTVRMRAAELNGRFRRLLNPGVEDGGGQVFNIGFFVMKGLQERGIRLEDIE